MTGFGKDVNQLSDIDADRLRRHLCDLFEVQIKVRLRMGILRFFANPDSLRKKLGSFHSDELGNLRGNARLYDRESRSNYPYKSRGQPFRATVSGIVCAVVVLFNGWDTFSPFKLQDFIANYISVGTDHSLRIRRC